MHSFGEGDGLDVNAYDAETGEHTTGWKFLGNGSEQEHTLIELPFNAAERTRIELHWMADETDNEYFGVEIKEIKIKRAVNRAEADTELQPAYRHFSGTSMASPQVTGAAALILAEHPEAKIPELVMRLHGAGKSLPQLEEKTLLGKSLDVAAALGAEGSLTFLDDGGNRTWSVSQKLPLVWTHFDQPEQPVTFHLLDGGAPIITIAEDYTGIPKFLWQIPFLEAGQDYQIQLTSGEQRLVGAPFEISKTEFLEIEDPQFQAYAQEHLDQDGDGRISNFEAESVQFLNCSSWNISKLPDLSLFKRLIMLICNDNRLEELPPLDHLFVSRVECSGNRLTELPRMPDILGALECANNRLTEFPDLSNVDRLRGLDISGNFLREMPSLSPVQTLNVANNLLTQLPPLWPELSNLYANGNMLESLPALPSNLRLLEISHNQVENLPDLPESLTWLQAKHNRLTQLPVLPDGLSVLWVSGNQIAQLPEQLPTGLRHLDVSHNPIGHLPDLTQLQKLSRVFAENSQLTEVPQLPEQDPDRTFLSLAHFNENPFSRSRLCGPPRTGKRGFQ